MLQRILPKDQPRPVHSKRVLYEYVNAFLQFNKRQREHEHFTVQLLLLLFVLLKICVKCDGGLGGEEEMNVAELYSNGN